VTSRRARIDRLTARWRSRHEARRTAVASRPAADPDREALAARAFPFRSVSPARYADDHADDMPGFTYDEVSYADPELDAWLLALGEELRRRRAGPRG
jgi:hypothetical protein